MKPFEYSYQKELFRRIVRLGHLEDRLINRWNKRDKSGNLWPDQRHFYYGFLRMAKKVTERRSLAVAEYNRLYGGL